MPTRQPRPERSPTRDCAHARAFPLRDHKQHPERSCLFVQNCGAGSQRKVDRREGDCSSRRIDSRWCHCSWSMKGGPVWTYPSSWATASPCCERRWIRMGQKKWAFSAPSFDNVESRVSARSNEKGGRKQRTMRILVSNNAGAQCVRGEKRPEKTQPGGMYTTYSFTSSAFSANFFVMGCLP